MITWTKFENPIGEREKKWIVWRSRLSYLPSSELLRNFLWMSANDFVRELPEEVLEGWCKDFSVAQNRLMSIQASHPIGIGSVWR